MAKIKHVRARQIIDCMCRPMVEVDVETEDGACGRGSAPTGISVGMHEAYILRDGDPAEYDGLSVHKAVDHVNQLIGPAIRGMDVVDQRGVDTRMLELDGSPNKRNLGVNAIGSVSIACLRAAAASAGVPAYQYICGRAIRTVPVPSFNVINGGRYGEVVQPFNEFLIVPYRADSIGNAVEIAVKVFQCLERILLEYQGIPPLVARSYGWAAPSGEPEVILALMERAVKACGYAGKVAYALDCASSEMYDRQSGTYLLHGRRVEADALIDYAKELSGKFPLVFIEDILDEDDWTHYPLAKERIARTLIIGDDLIVSNRKRLQKAFEEKAVDGYVLKPNQVGTITEVLDTYRYGAEHGMIAIPSGRSGGTLGDIAIDLAVGLEVRFIKNGAPRSGERIEKLNFLMRASDLSPGCALADLSPILRF